MRITKFILLSTLIIAAAAPNLTGQVAFSAIFRFQQEAQETLVGGTWDELLNKHRQLTSAGFALLDLEPVVTDKEVHFWATWSQTGTPTSIERTNGWANLVKLKNQRAAQGLVLEDLESYAGPYGDTWYIGIWIPGNTSHKAIRVTTRTGLEQSTAVLAREFFYLVDVEVVKSGSGEWQYLCLFQQRSPDWRSFLVLTSDEETFYQEKYQRNQSGYQLIDLESFQADGQTQLLGLFRKGDSEDNCRLYFDWASLRSYQKFLGEGFAIVDLEAVVGDGQLVAPPSDQTRMATTPNISHQVVIAAAGQEHADQSAACAGANALLWLAQNGFPNLLPAQVRSSARIVTTLANLLADGDHMKSLQTESFSIYSVIDGLTTYSTECNYRIKAVKVQNLRYFDERQLRTESARARIVIDDQHPPTLEFARTGLIGNSIVLIQWGTYRTTPDGDLLRQGTSWGTLVGHGVNEQGNLDARTLIIHSPAHDRQDALYAQVEKLANTTPLAPNARLTVAPTGMSGPDEPVPAHKAWILSGLADERQGTFAIWESTFVFQYEDPRIAQILQRISQDD